VLQNASKCTISKEKMPKFFSPDPNPTGEGDTPSPDPIPVDAFGASIRVPKALDPPPDHISGYGPAWPDPGPPFHISKYAPGYYGKLERRIRR